MAIARFQHNGLFGRVVSDKRYVADPRKGGRHCRGTAVDVTLVDITTKKEVPMPTEFDNFTQKAWRSYTNLPDEIIQNRQQLEDVMQRHGFIGLPTEWWHFDYQGWKHQKSLDIDFEKLEK